MRSNPGVSDGGLKAGLGVVLHKWGRKYVGSSAWPYDMYTAVRKAFVKKTVEALDCWGKDYPLCGLPG